MAASSRQTGLFGVNDWKALYQTFKEADFKSYDYETLRKSFIDYLRLYYPENFNDYTESSEFIALLDIMAFMGQGLAFRNDLNARENFIDTAERRDSVIKLAELVSYTPKRNITAQGYLKVVSIQTTQNITDINGINLSNIPIIWNDPANNSWLEQFNTIINAALVDTQRIGKPGNSSEILNVSTSEYSIRIPDGTLPIGPFSTSVDGQAMNFELVSATSVGSDQLYEIPPLPAGRFNLLYRNDRLGFGSPETGFFFYFKQGRLQAYDFTLDQEISNRIVNIGSIEGVNNSDTWLYNLSNNSDIPNTLWERVDNVYVNEQGQSEDSNKRVFSVRSRFNDQVSYVFGDGVFSEVPIGTFRAYVRSSNGQTYNVDPSEMQGITVAINYVSRQGRTETLVLGLELTQTVSTAQERESLADIKRRAPTRFYTQNRMVNGEDYNNFPFSMYNSIIKSKALNRSSVGVSKNLDLLDPTGKYSSTTSLGTDGAIYQDTADQFLTLSISDTSDIISFFSNELSNVLRTIGVNQFYVETYPRYNTNQESGDGTVYWQTSTVNASSETGYFYNIDGVNNTPKSIGPFNTTNVKYITAGAMLKFTAPAGYYFDTNNRLVSGIPPTSSQTYIWVTVLDVQGDGSNNGQGSFANGSGPVTLTGYIPSGVTLTTVIPSFDNTLSSSVVNDCLIRMELQQDFTLIFDNSVPSNQERWYVSDINDESYIVKFISTGNNNYTITFKSLVYYFGSVADTRFVFNKNAVVYDPFTGKTVQDHVNILPTNTLPNSFKPLTKTITVNVIGQTIESDGYVNDYNVIVASTDSNNSQIIINPDFFNELTGYVFGQTNTSAFVFFETIQDSLTLVREQIVPTSTIVYQYQTKAQIEIAKYEYPVGQIFYAYGDDLFYKTVQDPTITTPSYSVVVQTKYSVKPGRQGLTFHYVHNSNNTARIDPATTNIIDIYVVTQAYYTSYKNWIQDTSNTVIKPTVPTVEELSQTYGDLQQYKMLTDSVVLNSVVFKPLFGSKADPALQGTIKVIRQSGVIASDSEIRSVVLEAMNNYFSVNNWNFGDTFFFSELSAYLHAECGEMISSAVLVPKDPSKSFGDLYEIKCMPYEIFVNAATANDVVVVSALTPSELQVSSK